MRLLPIGILKLPLAVLVSALVAAGTSGFAQSPKKEANLQEYCPVYTDLKVSFSDSPTVRYKGIKVRLSSREALLKWHRDPSAYFDKKFLPQLSDLQPPERGIVQLYCPVYRERKVSRKDPFVVYQGHKVYLFDESAVRKWNRAPDRYADEAVLPQLKATKPAAAESPETAAEKQP